MSTKWKREGTCLVVDEAGNSICIVSSTAANAHLIAAAPEQNRALVAMIQAFTRHPGNEDERHHALTLAQAAIAKAGTPA